MRANIWTGAIWRACIALAIATHGYAAEASSKKARPAVEAAAQILDRETNQVQLITFPDTDWNPVKVVRGNASGKRGGIQKIEAEKTESAEIVTFSGPEQASVRVMRGETDRTATLVGQPRRHAGMMMELVSFRDPRERPVSILRGSVLHTPDTGLFGPASDADLDRIAFAVDGAESSHGADLRMWRVEPSGPQGPMQVTAAAALDVGGGDRFDIAENRLLGRAYLARMYRRYGNWPDAIAAYNWGPGNVDAWIDARRSGDKFPLEVERYRDRVLRDAALVETSATTLRGGWPFGTSAFRTPAIEEPAPLRGAVDGASAYAALKPIALAGATALDKIVASIRSRAANWRSAYSAFGNRISQLVETHPQSPEMREARYSLVAAPD
jgi:Transglycosylase SLT domain